MWGYKIIYKSGNLNPRRETDFEFQKRFDVPFESRIVEQTELGVLSRFYSHLCLC